VTSVKRTLLAVTISVMLVGTAVASLWLMASAGVFDAGGGTLPHAATETTLGGSTQGNPPAGAARLVQPRDPFEPLISPPTTVPDESTTTTAGGETTTTTSGGDTTTTTSGGDTTTTTDGGDTTTTTTVPGSTTTTTQGDEPEGIRVVLLEIREEGGVRTAVLTVDGETYTAGVGEVFAEDFKVISLGENSGVFTYGDSAFTLAVGQAIIK
jgi:hypothetical protein